MHRTVARIGCSLGVVIAATSAAAQSAPPCNDESYDAHAFRVGVYRAIDSESGEAVGIQEVQRIAGRCGYSIRWRQLNDRFRAPGSTERYEAYGVIGRTGDDWFQTLVDNMGGVATSQGSVDDRGVYFDSSPGSQGAVYRTYIVLDTDGVLWNEGYMRENETADWRGIWRLRYERIED